jgi:hypothetical protein
MPITEGANGKAFNESVKWKIDPDEIFDEKKPPFSLGK